ncbi:MAG: 16S rRNA (guanine(966)-N(2))-methyltransferase RsmD [Chloroflexi bacterium AL-N1]|nr:16S rRNA (guanine(966)-N(2))-methyltransferase RsmD [Chloroflexi bacterium AL-N1]NOK77312.1 16S rRNA (guanine(966)-N(2))-methyltransferase RsmD [Chloroflexi bacterium AL-N5]
MRVITGSAKGHKLKAPKGMGTRPMLDRVKEALFSVLEGYNAIHGRVLDLYAGTGSLGIECLSRGAEWTDFVERSSQVCRIIQDNLQHTRLQDRAQVVQLSVERFLATVQPDQKYAIITMDPPYADPAIHDTIRKVAELGLLDHEGILIVGHSPRVDLEDTYGQLKRIKYRRLGDSCFSIYEPETIPKT